MTLTNFIFFNQLKYRLGRHLALWIGFSVYFFVVNFTPRSAQDLLTSKTFLIAFQRMIYLPVSIISVYISIYFLLPKFILKAKYFKFFILLFCLCLINLASAWLLTKLWAQFAQTVPFQQLPMQVAIFQPVIYGLGLGTAASGFAIIIKLLKVRYLKQKENERLQQQKITTELQMIKTNFHPHFLSDALQNIADLIRDHSTQSPEVILKLSDLLSFILYESEEELIPLEKELLMIKDYLDLEKTFYGNRIVVNLKEEGNIDGKTIAPLILVSLVQNCCEQFLISLQQKLTIEIEIKTEDKKFIFRLSCNGYYENINGIPRQNTGLNQALRRIQVIYPGKHKLETHSENGFFSMMLIIEPEAISRSTQKKTEDQFFYESA
jgi:sensor histidine kinase YesM